MSSTSVDSQPRSPASAAPAAQAAFRYQGSVDLAALGTIALAASPVTRDGRWCVLHAAGIDLRWDPTHAELATTAGVLALVAGEPRRGVQRIAAAELIERYRAAPQSVFGELSGGFAAILVDAARRRCELVVDRFCIETLCFRSGADKLDFSDSASAVRGSNRALDPQALYEYLYFHVIPSPRTIYRDVRRLVPAERLIVEAGATRSESFWDPVFVESDRRDLEARLARFRELTRAAVAAEASSPDTACFLSGGTDSSTVCGMLAGLREGPVHAYSIGFEAEGYDEMEYARIAARHFGLAHHEYYLTPDDLVRSIPAMAAEFDQPFGNSSVVAAYHCALRAREDGFGRMLAGDGGDELFGGNSRYAMQQVFQWYHGVPRALRRGVLEPAATGTALFRRVPGLKQMGGYVRHARVPMPDRLQSFNLLDRIGPDTMLEPAFLAQVDREEPLRQQRDTWQAVHARSLLNRMLGFDWKYTLADSDIPKVRSATDLAGVRVGYPFLDTALTEFSLSVPPQWKLRHLKLRWFFKKALADFLPEEILRKKKHGFGLPFGPWALRHAGLRRLAEESVHGVAARGLVRSEFATELLAHRLPEAPGYYGEMVWVLMMLEQWLRSHER